MTPPQRRPRSALVRTGLATGVGAGAAGRSPTAAGGMGSQPGRRPPARWFRDPDVTLRPGSARESSRRAGPATGQDGRAGAAPALDSLWILLGGRSATPGAVAGRCRGAHTRQAPAQGGADPRPAPYAASSAASSACEQPHVPHPRGPGKAKVPAAGLGEHQGGAPLLAGPVPGRAAMLLRPEGAPSRRGVAASHAALSWPIAGHPPDDLDLFADRQRDGREHQPHSSAPRAVPCTSISPVPPPAGCQGVAGEGGRHLAALNRWTLAWDGVVATVVTEGTRGAALVARSVALGVQPAANTSSPTVSKLVAARIVPPPNPAASCCIPRGPSERFPTQERASCCASLPRSPSLSRCAWPTAAKAGHAGRRPLGDLNSYLHGSRAACRRW
jgi:hypothetical protein